MNSIQIEPGNITGSIGDQKGGSNSPNTCRLCSTSPVLSYVLFLVSEN